MPDFFVFATAQFIICWFNYQLQALRTIADKSLEVVFIKEVTLLLETILLSSS